MSFRAIAIGFMTAAAVACARPTEDRSAGVSDEALASAVTAVVVTSHQGDTTLVTYVSSLGVATTQYGADGAPIRGAVVSYLDGTTLGLDYGARTYASASLAAMVDRRLTDLATFQAATPADGVAPPPIVTPTIVRTRLRAQIGGANAHAYDVDEGNGHTTRVWYAQGLPLPPVDLRVKLAALEPAVLPPSGSGDDDGGDDDDLPCDGQTSGVTPGAHTAGRQVLRIEALSGASSTLLFDTDTVTRTKVPASTFSPPSGWTPAPLKPLPTGPVGPAFDGPPATLTADVINAGVTADHPEIYLFYWGKSFADPAHNFAMQQVARAVDDVFTSGYTDRLADYGIHAPVLEATLTDDSDPPFAIGGGAVGAHAGGFVTEQPFLHPHLPRYWWEVGGHDPIYAMMVPEDVVEKDDWDGFHFMVHTFADLELPFPVNLFVHIGMPYLIVKVPADARDNSFFVTPADRVTCKLATGLGAKCKARNAVDRTTIRFSHELVEASTDPEPFLGFADLIRNTKAFAYGEIADICASLSESQPYPWAPQTLVNGVAVATYWDEDLSACVPASQPTLTIIDPAASPPIPWTGPNGPVVGLSAVVHDPAVGDLPAEACRWSVDGIDVRPPAPSCAFDDDCLVRFTGQRMVCRQNRCFQACEASDISCVVGTCTGQVNSRICDQGDPPSLVTPPLSLGIHRIRAVYTGLLDETPQLTAEAEVTVLVTAFAPSVSIDSPADGASIPADQFVTLRGTAVDPQDGVLRGSQVGWAVNGVSVGVDDVLSLTLPGPGDATIAFTATNSAGLTATATRTVHVTAPTGMPSVTIVAPLMNQNFFYPDQKTVQFEAFARDPGGTTIPPENITWVDDVDGFLGTGPTPRHDMSGSIVGPVTHTVTVTVVGANGTQTDTVTFTVGEVG